MKLTLFRYKCGTCKEWFEAPDIDGGEFRYGEFLLRSESQEMRYFNAALDPVFEEVHSLLNEDARYRSLDKFRQADIHHKMFGATCDPESLGNSFCIGRVPKCGQCQSSNILAWACSEPPRFAEIEILSVTHFRWESLSDDEKRILIIRSLRNFWDSDSA